MARKKTNLNMAGTPRGSVLDFFVDRRRFFMPVLVMLCVALTVFIALRLSKPAETTPSQGSSEVVNEIAAEGTLMVNTDPQITALVTRYYEARANGDQDVLDEIARGRTESERLQDQEYAKYVDYFTIEEIYSKPGPFESTYIVYVHDLTKLFDYDKPIPGFDSFFVRQEADGSCYMDVGPADDTVKDYIRKSSLYDGDVVDLSNRINVEYNEMRQDKVLEQLLSDIDKNVYDAVASQKASQINDDAQTAASAAGTGATPEPKEVFLKATDEINVRASASAEATLVGTTKAGAVYRRVGVEGEWSRIEYNGQEAYVKTEFFTITDEQPASTAMTAGEHTIATGSRVRKEPNTESEILDETVPGDKVEVLDVLDDGWCKVEFNGKTGYIMAEFIAP